MKRWWVCFLLRIFVYGGLLGFVLRRTATKFDETEWNAVFAFTAIVVAFEGVLALAIETTHSRKGKMRWLVAPTALALVLTCNALRPRTSEVSVKYTGTMKSLEILAEVVRWQR